MTQPLFTDAEKAEEARRELKLRRRVYPRYVRTVADGKLADRRIALMCEIAEEYEARSRNGDLLGRSGQ